MPEGPTLHRLARSHQQMFAGDRVEVCSPQGKFTGAERVSGQAFVRASAWGKHLLHQYESGLLVHVHLALYGTFTPFGLPPQEPVGQVRMRVLGPGGGTDLRGATTCEVITRQEWQVISDRLGPDPLRRGADGSRAWERIHRSRRTIASLLMDQSVVAGVGNVYRAELLYRHRISPDRPGTGLDRATWDAMWADLVTMMRLAVRKGAIITIRPQDDHGEPAYAKDRPRTYVYRRLGSVCRICQTPIAHRELEGRNLFWCPACQDR